METPSDYNIYEKKMLFQCFLIQVVDFFFQIWISTNVLAAVFTFCWLKATRFSIYFELSLNQDQSQLSSSIRSEVTYENRRIGQNADMIKKNSLQSNVLQHCVHISCSIITGNVSIINTKTSEYMLKEIT